MTATRPVTVPHTVAVPHTVTTRHAGIAGPAATRAIPSRSARAERSAESSGRLTGQRRTESAGRDGTASPTLGVWRTRPARTSGPGTSGTSGPGGAWVTRPTAATWSGSAGSAEPIGLAWPVAAWRAVAVARTGTARGTVRRAVARHSAAIAPTVGAAGHLAGLARVAVGRTVARTRCWPVAVAPASRSRRRESLGASSAGSGFTEAGRRRAGACRPARLPVAAPRVGRVAAAVTVRRLVRAVRALGIPGRRPVTRVVSGVRVLVNRAGRRRSVTRLVTLRRMVAARSRVPGRGVRLVPRRRVRLVPRRRIWLVPRRRVRLVPRRRIRLVPRRRIRLVPRRRVRWVANLLSWRPGPVGREGALPVPVGAGLLARRESARPRRLVRPRAVGGLVALTRRQPKRLRRRLNGRIPALIRLGIVPDLTGRVGVVPDLAGQVSLHGSNLDRLRIHRPRLHRAIRRRTILPGASQLAGERLAGRAERRLADGRGPARRDDGRDRPADPERIQPLVGLDVARIVSSKLPAVAIARAGIVRLALPRPAPAPTPPDHD